MIDPSFADDSEVALLKKIEMGNSGFIHHWIEALDEIKKDND